MSTYDASMSSLSGSMSTIRHSMSTYDGSMSTFEHSMSIRSQMDTNPLQEYTTTTTYLKILIAIYYAMRILFDLPLRNMFFCRP